MQYAFVAVTRAVRLLYYWNVYFMDFMSYGKAQQVATQDLVVPSETSLGLILIMTFTLIHSHLFLLSICQRKNKLSINLSSCKH